MGKKNYQPQLVQDFVHQQYLKNTTLHSLQTNRAVPKKNGGIQESSGSAKPNSKEHRAVISAADHSLVGIQSSQVRREKGGGWIHAFSSGVFFSNETEGLHGFFGQKCYMGLVDLYMNMYACSTYNIYAYIMYTYIDVCIESYLHTIYIYTYQRLHVLFVSPSRQNRRTQKQQDPKHQKYMFQPGSFNHQNNENPFLTQIKI